MRLARVIVNTYAWRDKLVFQAFFASQNVDVTHGSGSGEELKNVKNEYRSKLTNQNLNACMAVGLEERS